MTWNRREALGALGLGSARALAWAFTGCAPRRSPLLPQPIAEVSGEVRTWLHDAIAALHGAGFARAHAIAVRRTRRTAAVDVLGASVARETADGAMLAVDGREVATGELSERGIAAAVQALVPRAAPRAPIEFGPPPPALAAFDEVDDAGLLDRVAPLASGEGRIVYAAGLLDLDDVTVWSVSRGRDLAARSLRVRRSATLVAWDRERPNAIEVARAWTGGLDDQKLDPAELAAARDAVLQPVTQGAFPSGVHPIALTPAVTAALIDATVRALLTSRAAERPEVAARLRGALGSPALAITDDPRAPGMYGGVAYGGVAYGGAAFEDDGVPAAPLALVDRGRVAGVIGGHRRWGHVGPVEPMPSHLRIAPGAGPIAIGDGYQLDGVRRAAIDPASGRVVLAVARALELAAGKSTGRVYAGVELTGDIGDVLASIAEVSSETRAFGVRDERDGLPAWRSIEAPFARARGALRGGA